MARRVSPEDARLVLIVHHGRPESAQCCTRGGSADGAGAAQGGAMWLSRGVWGSVAALEISRAREPTAAHLRSHEAACFSADGSGVL